MGNLMILLEYLKSNISWIKDIFTIIFSGTATILAILTYKKAKATILQPIRNEVIKKQSSILSEILKDISENESIDDGFDYLGIVQLNVFMILKEYGFIFNEDKKLWEKLDQINAGWIYCGESQIIKDVEVVGVFEDSKKNKENSHETGKQRFENLKRGIIELDKIYLTKKHKNFFKKFSEYADSPFLPENIQIILIKIIQDVKINLTTNLRLILVKFVKDFSEKYFADENPKFSYSGVYNEFNHNRIHHKPDFYKLKLELRAYLRIDDKWS
jgi:hypothetical protein